MENEIYNLTYACDDNSFTAFETVSCLQRTDLNSMIFSIAFYIYIVIVLYVVYRFMLWVWQFIYSTIFHSY